MIIYQFSEAYSKNVCTECYNPRDNHSNQKYNKKFQVSLKANGSKMCRKHAQIREKNAAHNKHISK